MKEKKTKAAPEPKYPDIKVTLAERDTFLAITSKILVALRGGGASKEDAEAFVKEAFAGTHDAMIQTAKRWVGRVKSVR